ncbi:something about silencing, SAS, complex subunit 4-domain-containing protein [Lipomyces kononenkoae]|uniref:Something about silencing, SAS, complex subunit 4-domain-containing protein n=1 Tax=Lipomyces kononenkoae TaxID=34357 RepID=A0ACC3T3H9_LIPKO
MPSLDTIVTYLLGSSQSSLNSISSQHDKRRKERSTKIDKSSGHAKKTQAAVASEGVAFSTSPKEQDNKRQLRSERSRLRLGTNGATHAVESDEEDLLWFENLDDSVVDYDEELQISDEPLTRTKDPTLESRPQRLPFSSIVNPISARSKASLYDTPVNIRSRSDPLSDSVFVGLHKRREREERHYQNFERDKVMYNKLQMERQLDRLKGRDWVKAVVSMTPVTDPKCVQELITKRDKLIQELVKVLAKFESWKEREKKIKSLNGEDEELLSSMRSRLQERKKEVQGVHGMSSELGNGRRRAKRSHQIAETSTSITREVQRSKRTSRRLDSELPNPRPLYTTYTSNSNSKQILAFGYPLPRIRYRQFHIPLEWVENREKLRQSDDSSG